MSDTVIKKQQEIKRLENKVKFLKQKVSKEKSYSKRKQREHNLIKKGALLEIVKIQYLDSETLLGFFANFSKYSDAEIEEFKKIGSDILEKRKQKREEKPSN